NGPSSDLLLTLTRARRGIGRDPELAACGVAGRAHVPGSAAKPQAAVGARDRIAGRNDRQTTGIPVDSGTSTASKTSQRSRRSPAAVTDVLHFPCGRFDTIKLPGSAV